MNQVINLEERRNKKILQKRLDKLDENIKELKELEVALKSCLSILNKHEKYANIRRRIEDIFYLYQDTQRTISNRYEVRRKLQNEIN